MQTHPIRWQRLATIGLATWFIALSAMRLSVIWPDRAIDMRLYLRGTSEWLSGGDPWTIHFGTMHFAAAPPSLLPMVPFALLPEAIAVPILSVLAVVASFWTLRKLGLPLWWIAWPPLVDNLWNLNPQIFLVPLLLGSAAWLAPIVKAYAVVPLIIQWRVRTLAITAVVGVVTFPLLPWATFFQHMATTTTLLSEQSQGGMSAWIFPVLVPFTIVALFAMGRQRASWWAVPALWPSTQWYYSLMAMPALTPLTAAILAAPVQGGPAVATIAAALEIWYRRRRARDTGEQPGDDQPAAATSDGRTVRAPSS